MIRSFLFAVPLLTIAGFVALPADPPPAPTEAPASFLLVTNGVTSQADFLANLEDFSQEASEAGDDEPGLGPTFNGVSCKSCHLNPAVGGGLSRFELRAGKLDPTGAFVAPAGGTLVRQLAVDPACQQRVPDGFFVTKRRSTSLFGLGYVEAVADATLVAIRDAQPADVRGIGILVPATTGVTPDGLVTKTSRVGRFGWKCQQATLLDFAADALINEIGRTSLLQPDEMPGVDGRNLGQFKKTPPGEFEDPPTDGRAAGHDVVAYAQFMRALQAPPRDFTLAGTDDAKAGARLFGMIGCAACHTPTMPTSPTAAAAVANKLIRPFSDFLLHDIGTGDTEVVQAGPDSTRKMLRTAPLWGVRLVPEMGHDGRWATFADAIEGHAGQASGARANYRLLTPGEQRQLRVFLSSL